jgi:hypothetical protein
VAGVGCGDEPRRADAALADARRIDRDRVDHGPGSHDDRANAVAGVVSLLAGHDPSDLGITVGNLR